MPFETPIVLIVYNRVETTKQIFSMIKSIQPANLFIVADGAKNSEDEYKVNATREIVKHIDWNCDLKINFSETNMGCAERVISGLDWVFKHVDKAIILEDDCLPHIDFFKFCKELLSYYEHANDIMHISGFNILGEVNSDTSYFYSNFILPPWGWATWKRAWVNFNKDLDTWQQIKIRAVQNINQNYFAEWTNMFEHIRINRTTWDVPWNTDLWKKNGLGIIPHKSLIQNIGFGPQATFTKNTTIDVSLILGQNINFPLLHPKEKIIPFDKEIEHKIIAFLKLNSNTEL